MIWIVYNWNDCLTIYSIHDSAKDAVKALGTLGYGKIAEGWMNKPLDQCIDEWEKN